ncbi:MAG: hypothetical protein E6G47_12330 [Actinobacteria bacterium]|nr:MAG: hypothetical protein E6G47_12330 [Actinomycetota bacterium]
MINVCLEIGAKRVFASALDWPGWSRAARDEEGALHALFDYRSRYRAVVAGRRLGFVAPKDASVLRVVERIPGDATTDFGAPGRIAKADRRRTTERDVRRLQSLLIACWEAFDEAAGTAKGRTLRTGARGGGRSPRPTRATWCGSVGRRTVARPFASTSSRRSPSPLAWERRRPALVAAGAGLFAITCAGRRGTRWTTHGRSRTG